MLFYASQCLWNPSYTSVNRFTCVFFLLRQLLLNEPVDHLLSFGELHFTMKIQLPQQLPDAHRGHAPVQHGMSHVFDGSIPMETSKKVERQQAEFETKHSDASDVKHGLGAAVDDVNHPAWVNPEVEHLDETGASNLAVMRYVKSFLSRFIISGWAAFYWVVHEAPSHLRSYPRGRC